MKHKSMVRQVQETLQVQLRIGESRHQAKNEESTHAPAGIFSYRTFETYLKQSCAFASWAKAQYGSRTLSQARPHVEAYLQSGIDRGLSAYTLSTQRAALCKLYGCTARDFAIKLPERLRADIQRSRNDVPDNKEYEEMTGLVYDYVSAVESVYMEIGLQVGAILAAQVCQNLKTAYEGD
ncbi:hypothetical protein [Gehongia tenuis]|uniref:Uncharacterized protein n=1 Tax=Gehongia tenuis TaxID=2763655 RepID=A0A926HN81_9FIRM|nr:hypothetical protein [Gehongia tenuis]MBC8530314.1 hypothetical protein [Gehongia tenuis]